MKDNFLKEFIKHVYLFPGAVRCIGMGPLRGTIFKIDSITGLSPWYSGSERDHQNAFKKLVKAGNVVIDIGANWGVHTLYLSKLVQKRGRVIAIEPYSPAFVELEWHLAANHRSNVTALSIAISDQDGEAQFLPGESASTGSLDIAASQTDRPVHTITVTTRTLDTLCQDLHLKHLDLIKIDVEGNEGCVLSGAHKTITKYRPYLVIDLHTPEQDLKVAQWLIERRYDLKRLNGPPICRTDTGWPDPQGVWGSIVAAPAD